MNPEAARALLSIAGLLVVVAVLFWLYPCYRVDLFRQKLFELRDELFLFAADEGIGFDHPAYGMLRSTINGHIQFGHRLNLLEVMLFAVFLRRQGLGHLGTASFQSKWESVAKSLTPAQADRLEGIRRRMTEHVTVHCIHMSPFFVLFSLLLLIPLAVARTLAGRIISALSLRYGDRVATAALAVGSA